MLVRKKLQVYDGKVSWEATCLKDAVLKVLAQVDSAERCSYYRLA